MVDFPKFGQNFELSGQDFDRGHTQILTYNKCLSNTPLYKCAIINTAVY